MGILPPPTSSKLDPKDFKWGAKEDNTFNDIKWMMTPVTCLKNIKYDSINPLWLFTDTSRLVIGAALSQGKGWKYGHPVAY